MVGRGFQPAASGWSRPLANSLPETGVASMVGRGVPPSRASQTLPLRQGECREAARGYDTNREGRGPSYENKSQAGKIALVISASRSEVPDLCLSPIRSEGRRASLQSITRLAGVPPCGRAVAHEGPLALTRGRDIQAKSDWVEVITLSLGLARTHA